jgi:hypothetical protein
MSELRKFRKKLVFVDAIRLSSSPGKHGDQIAEWREIEALFPRKVYPIGNNVDGQFECICFTVPNGLGKYATAKPGDWIVRDDAGDVFPVEPQDFSGMYEISPTQEERHG